jgi:LPS sulfotransferase NodH
MPTQTVQQIFDAPVIENRERHEKLIATADPAIRYVIAMTPRSGSSHLCDVLKNGKLFGKPNEMLSREFIPKILTNIPASTTDQYLDHVFRATASSNGISGIKCSWFQFREFRDHMKAPENLLKLKFIYLIRRDSALQAVSLYRATQTNVFHTNVKHTPEALAKLEKLGYDYAQIKFWHAHILKQEEGWKAWFAEQKIFPLCLHYEDIDENVTAVCNRIAHYIGRPLASRMLAPEASVFRKLGSRTSLEWACRFSLELDAEERAKEPAPAGAETAGG